MRAASLLADSSRRIKDRGVRTSIAIMTTSFRFAAIRLDRRQRVRGPASALAAAAVSAVLLAAPAYGQADPYVPADAVAGKVTEIAGFTTRDMLSRLNQPWVQLIDVRPAQQYAGRDIRTLRGGHIPGAINLPIERRPAAHGRSDGSAASPGPDAPLAVASKLAALDPRKETIVYGNDVAEAARFAELLEREGFRQVRLYAPGWPAWADALELPVANERFADVGSLRRQIDELQRTVARYAARGDETVQDAGSVAGPLHSAHR